MRYLHDYVLMVPPDGGDTEKVPTAGDEIAKRMVRGWVQVEPERAPEEEKGE